MTEATRPLVAPDGSAPSALALEGLPACRNCGAPATGKFCIECGQKTDVHIPSLGEFLHEFISHHVAFDGTLIASVKRLLFSPGGLTLDYFAGKRARYVAPLRLYLTFNVIFFLAVQLLPAFGSGGNEQDAKKALSELKDTVDAQQVLDQAASEINADQSLTDEQRRIATEKLQVLRAAADVRAKAMSAGTHAKEADRNLSVSVGAPPQAAVSSGSVVVAVPLAAGHVVIATPDAAASSGSVVAAQGRASASSGAVVSPKTESGDADEDNDVADAQQERDDARRDALNAVRSDLKSEPSSEGGPAVKVSSHPKKWQQVEDAIIPAWVDQHAPIVRRRLDAVPNRTPGQFRDNAVHYAPYTLLMLLPVCAFLLQLSFIGRRRRYVEHLVAALHGHTFLFIALLLFVPFSGMVAFLLLVAAAVHMIIALSRIYGSRGIGLMLRLGVLFVTYTIAFTFATIGEFILSVLT